MTIEQLAKIVHESNKTYCEVHGDMSQKPWEEAEEWQRESAINEVLAHFDHPDRPPSWSHEHWMQQKVDAGWVYGPVKDSEKKTHPDLVPYDQLSPVAQGKDYLFSAIVNGLVKFVER